MRSKFKWIFTLLLAFSMQFSFAQEKIISGVVTDGDMPLPGANVLVKGTNRATSTDFDGKYSISARPGEVLEFSYIGMETTSVTVGASSTINVPMVTDNNVLQTVELVTEGYNRTRTRRNTNSAVTTISSEQIENRPNASFLNSLQGTAPGLSILSSSGSPGSAKIEAFVRGLSSLNASTDPLIVIDNVPTNANQFRNLNQNDIETITVLRDAAATSIYGNRGANGVLLITTKQGKFGSAFRITYDAVSGVSVLPKNKYNMSNSQQVLTLENRLAVGLGGTLTEAEIAAWDGPNTNWRDRFYSASLTQQHNLGLSFGGENVANYTSIGYYMQDGMVPTTDFQRFTLRNNLNGKSSNGKFTYNSQLALGYSKRNELNQETNNGVNNNTIQNPLHGSVMGLPYVAANQFNSGQQLFDAIGTNFSGPNDTYVLEDILREGSMPSWFVETSISANIAASYKLTDELTLGNKAGIDYKVNDRVFARAPDNYLAIAVRETTPRAGGIFDEFGGLETMSNQRDFTFTNVASLNYSKLFNEVHRLDAGIYMEYMKAHYLFKTHTQNGLNPRTYVPGAGTGYIAYNPANPQSYTPTGGASKLDAGTLSYFASVDYDYKEKYGFGAVIRRDASYKFVEDNQWGTFWSVSGRWNIDQEAFMEGSTFSLLKLRASYGTQGNQNILAPAPGFNPIYLAATNTRDLNAAAAGYNNQQGLFTSQLGNPLLRWEEISQANIGLDFIVLDSRLEGNVDVYRKQTEKLFNTINLSAVTGSTGIAGNNGGLRNSGIEVMLRYNLFKGQDFKMSVFANGSYNKNEIIAIDDADQSGNDNVNYLGGQAYQWNLIPYIGVNQSNGNLLFMDADGNPTENPDVVADRRATNKNFLPKYQGGFGFNAEFKGFYADVLFSWSKDFWRQDNQLRWAYEVTFIGDDNVSSDMLNAWTPTNPSNFPSLTANNATADVDSDRFLYDSSFLRLKNASIGYNFPKKYLDNTFLTGLRFFVQGENLLTWTKWRGFDPESTSALAVTAYPNPKTVSFGVNVQF